MYKQVEKPKEIKGAVANSVAQKKGNEKQGFGFLDNRSETIAQMKFQEMANNSPQFKQLKALQHMVNNQSIAGEAIQRYTDEEMESFHEKQKVERQAELQKLNNGFVMHGAFQPGPVFRGAQGLAHSRFDLSEIQNKEHLDHIEEAILIGSKSKSQNQLAAGVGMDLFGRMLRNVGRLKEDNLARELANMSGSEYYRPFLPKTDPSKAVGAESAKLKIKVNQGLSPHYNQEENEISLMNPSKMDQTAHELQHASDHLHGDLDLNKKDHRIVSELNAFTRQDIVSKELSGASPDIFEGKSPEQMAKTYEGKEKKGYTGTLESSKEAVRKWREEK